MFRHIFSIFKSRRFDITCRIFVLLFTTLIYILGHTHNITYKWIEKIVAPQENRVTAVIDLLRTNGKITKDDSGFRELLNLVKRRIPYIRKMQVESIELAFPLGNNFIDGTGKKAQIIKINFTSETSDGQLNLIDLELDNSERLNHNLSNITEWFWVLQLIFASFVLLTAVMQVPPKEA